MVQKENLYIIGFGLSGGFGGIQNYQVIEATSLEDAEKWAFEDACEEYESYAGTNGLRDIPEIMEEEGCDEEEACLIFEEERDSWLDYVAYPYSKELEKKFEGYSIDNRYKEFTDSL